MSTDLQNFINFYKSIGIDCVINIEKDEQVIYLAQGDYSDGSNVFTESEKFGGYRGFYSAVTFDVKGKFISQGFWE